VQNDEKSYFNERIRIFQLNKLLPNFWRNFQDFIIHKFLRPPIHPVTLPFQYLKKKGTAIHPALAIASESSMRLTARSSGYMKFFLEDIHNVKCCFCLFSTVFPVHRPKSKKCPKMTIFREHKSKQDKGFSFEDIKNLHCFNVTLVEFFLYSTWSVELVIKLLFFFFK